MAWSFSLDDLPAERKLLVHTRVWLSQRVISYLRCALVGHSHFVALPFLHTKPVTHRRGDAEIPKHSKLIFSWRSSAITNWNDGLASPQEPSLRAGAASSRARSR